MEKKKLFEPGDMVTTFTGQAGIVISAESLAKAKALFKEGRRPGHYFAPGCCHNPDFVTQVPVLFEDGTFDVMRSVNIKKKSDLPEQKKSELENLLATAP